MLHDNKKVVLLVENIVREYNIKFNGVIINCQSNRYQANFFNVEPNLHISGNISFFSSLILEGINDIYDTNININWN